MAAMHKKMEDMSKKDLMAAMHKNMEGMHKKDLMATYGMMKWAIMRKLKTILMKL